MKQEKGKTRCWVRYRVDDIATGYMLAAGERYKDVSKLDPTCTFYSGLNRITEYQRTATIRGRYCRITYWKMSIHAFRKRFSVVTPAGRFCAMRAWAVTSENKDADSDIFALGIGVSLSLFFLLGLLLGLLF